MLARDIYRDFYENPGPTIEERLFLAGKRIGIVLAGVALILGVLDFAGIHSISGAGNFVQAARSKIANLGNDVRGVATQAAIDSSPVSVRVAIPQNVVKVKRAASSPVDELAAARTKDAVMMAMTIPTPVAPTLVAPMARVSPAPNAPDQAPPAAAKAVAVPDIAAKAQASLTPAEQIQLASLPVQEPEERAAPAASTAPADATLTLAAPITIPLNEVPLPRPAPPLSPAERLNLKGKDYARAERCLANAIYFEARSEPIRGQMAVAQVVVNRAFSGFYPNDICGVVYQNASRHLACQFTFACDGKSKAITERGHWAVANRIARQTLDGQIYVPEVGKSTHYHAAYVHPNWVREMKKLVRFGVHSFYRPYAWGNGQEEPVWGTAATVAKLHKTASR